jgi:D-inositol-3-phosphate glycosyltransferase
VVEANALGVPVVATDAPGLRDAVLHEETGVLVAEGAPEVMVARLAEAIGSLLADEERLARLAAGALAWSRRFDWDASAAVMAEAVERARLGP